MAISLQEILEGEKRKEAERANKVPRGLALPKSVTDDKNRESNDFPQGCFPKAIENAISATNATLNYSRDYSGLSILAAAASAIGITLKAEVKKGFQQSVNIYSAIVGPPGACKTPVTTFYTKPLYERDKEFFKAYQKELKEFDELSSLSEKDRKQMGITQLIEPVLKKTVMGDFTNEAVIKTHSANLRGLLVDYDELAGFFKNLNRYNNGSDAELWLSVWSGKTIILDRKGSKSVFIEEPIISILGSIQPGILQEMGKDNRSKNGFTDRFLFAFPDNITVTEWSEKDLPDNISTEYSQVIKNLFSIPLTIDLNGSVQPRIVKYAPDAFKALKEWQKTNAELCNSEDKKEYAGVYTKLELYLIRISLILQAMYWAASEDDLQYISLRAVQSGIKLIEYFRYNSEKVFNIINHPDPTDDLTKRDKDLIDLLPESFTTSQGIEIASFCNVPERTFKRMLNKTSLFRRLAKGKYEKA